MLMALLSSELKPIAESLLLRLALLLMVALLTSAVEIRLVPSPSKESKVDGLHGQVCERGRKEAKSSISSMLQSVPDFVARGRERKREREARERARG